MSSFGDGRRYELAVLLSAMREQAGFTQVQVAEALMWSTTKMSRLESGNRKPILSDLLLLLPLYAIPVAQHQAIIQLARAARADALYASFSDILDPGEITYYEAFGDADVVRVHSGPLIPQVLRTREYDDAVHAAVGRSAPGRWLRLMNEVQPSLLNHAPENLIFVIDESALKRQVGTRSVMRHQLEHLYFLSEQCQILYIPFHAGPFGPDCFTLLDWKNDPQASLLCLPAHIVPTRISRDTKAIRAADRLWSELTAIAAPFARLE